MLMGCALPSCAPALLQQASALAYVSASTPPFLIMHGTNDHGVPIQQSEALYQALRAKGVAARLIEVAGADHMFVGATPQVMGQLLDRVFAWIDQPGGSGEETIQSGAGPRIDR
jgi:dipeptidyl aminopeptidase/acylaminoacyl peptidase